MANDPDNDMLLLPPWSGDAESPLRLAGGVHEVRRRLEEDVFVPDHEPRVATKEYRAVRRKLVEVEDRPCVICGVRNSTLCGTRRMETHHCVIEWSLMNAIDLVKFNARIAVVRYGREFSDAEMRDWIDHSEDNLMVLCNWHHRHKWVGVHAVTAPIWSAQALVKVGFDLTRLG